MKVHSPQPSSHFPTTPIHALQPFARSRKSSRSASPAVVAPKNASTGFVIQQAPADPLFGLMAKCKADSFENKVDLGVGAYRDNEGKPWILPVVRKVCITFFFLFFSFFRYDYYFFSLNSLLAVPVSWVII